MLPRALIPPDRPKVTVRPEHFLLERQADGIRRHAEVVLVEIQEGSTRGRGECVPDPAQGESIEDTVAAIEHFANDISTGVITRRSLQRVMPAGPVRNAIDLALWISMRSGPARRPGRSRAGRAPAADHILHHSARQRSRDGAWPRSKRIARC